MRFRPSILAAFFGVITVSASGHATDYSVTGPSPIATQSFSTPQGATGAVAFATNKPAMPFVVLGHAKAAQASDELSLANHLAGYGFAVFVPELCSPVGSKCAPDGALLKKSIDSIVAWTAPGGGAPASLAGKVTTSVRGYVGHGTGAQALLTSLPPSSVAGLVLLDPAAASGTDPSTLIGLQQAPTLALFASPGGCSDGSWEPFALKASVPTLAGTLIGGSHCDAAPTWLACPGVCGGSTSTDRQKRIKHYATAWLLAQLTKDAVATCEVTLAAMTQDALLTNRRASGVANCGAGGAGGAGGTGGASGKGGTGGGGTGGSGGTAGKGGATGGSGGASGAAAGSGGASGAAAKGGSGPGGGGAAAQDPDDGRNEYFELDQLQQEQLGDAESVSACSHTGSRGRAAAWLALPLLAGLFGWRRRSRA